MSNPRSKSIMRHWSVPYVKIATKRPFFLLALLLLITLFAGSAAERLEMRLNFSDMLPEHHPAARNYQQIMSEYGDPAVIIVLEGERSATVTAAKAVELMLKEIPGIYNIQGASPVDFFIEQGFIATKPSPFRRASEVYSSADLVGILRRFNDDYEREYSDSEENLQRDELDVSRSLLGLTQTLEGFHAALSGSDTSGTIVDESARSMLAGDQWFTSLDREMLLIAVTPEANIIKDVNGVLAMFDVIRERTDKLITESSLPVTVQYTGMGAIGRAEMDSVGPYTIFLSLIALVLIYLLMARSFRGWVLPLLGLIPLVFGIVWTMGFLGLFVGSLNIFTSMIGLVLLGLGIDFTIHLISRYNEERAKGASIEDALAGMLEYTGLGVLTGGLTTAAAFFALIVADTKGVHEFGIAAGAGVLLTILAVFLTLAPLLVLRERASAKLGITLRHARTSHSGSPFLGHIASFSWRHPIWMLSGFLLLTLFALFAANEIEFEYNFLNLEPANEPSVELQFKLPDKFGMSDQAAWLTVPTIDSSFALKEALRELPSVAAVQSISDLLPTQAQIDANMPELTAWHKHLLADKGKISTPTDKALYTEVNRLWDNLDLISNIAYQSGLDRITRVVDQITGYDSNTDATDSTAVLPRLAHLFSQGTPRATRRAFAARWFQTMQENLLRMTDATYATTPDQLPETLRRSFLPKDGSDEFLLTISPRKAVWHKENLDRFVQQIHDPAPHTIGTPQLFLIMTDETLRDGRNGALLALGIILILLIVHFRGLRGWMAIIPLAGSACLMVGMMYLIGMRYNYLNLIAVPIILGIGIDDGVHALHRFYGEIGTPGERIQKAFSHIGRAILLTSLTTMIGFGSIAFYSMRGMASFGIVLFMGVGFCFISTILVLPAVMRIFTKGVNRD